MRSRPLMKLMIFAVLVIAVESLDPTERGWNILAGKVKGNVALPTTASIVPEESVAAHRKPVAHRKVLSDSGPERFIQVVQKNGGTQDDCKQFADTTIQDIKISVTSQQDSLGTDIGAECAEMGQQGVSAAKKAVEDAETAASFARGQQDTACAATVTLPLSSLDTTGDYKTHSNFINAKDACAEAKTACVTADEDVADANRASKTATTVAALEVSECNCKVQKGQAAKWKNAQEVTTQHEETWKQAQGVLCALDQASTNCDPEANPCPTLTRPTLAAGVDDEDCAAPDAATKAPPKNTIKKDKDAESPCYVQQDTPCKDGTTITTEDDCLSASKEIVRASLTGFRLSEKGPPGCYFMDGPPGYYFNTKKESVLSCSIHNQCICKLC